VLKKIIKNRNLLSLLLAICIFSLLMLISYFDFLYNFDKKIQSLISRTNNISNNIVVVEIDDKTLEDGSL
jgi:type II secretory pathway component PulJ